MATGKSSSTKRKTKKEQMEEMERKENFRNEIILWIIIGFSLLLFISNFGVGGVVGDAVNRFFFGLFGLFAYIFPFALVVGSFFIVSNKGNKVAGVKIAATVLLILFLCTFMSLVITSEQPMIPPESFRYSWDNKLGGGFFGGAVSYVLLSGFGKVGAYIIDIIVLIISLILLTGHSAMKGMQKGGKKVYETAKENNERYQEYREYKEQEREKRRADNVVTGVSTNTKIEPKKKKSRLTDELSEIQVEEYIDLPEVKEEQKISLTAQTSAPEPSVTPMITGNFSRAHTESVSHAKPEFYTEPVSHTEPVFHTEPVAYTRSVSQIEPVLHAQSVSEHELVTDELPEILPPENLFPEDDFAVQNTQTKKPVKATPQEREEGIAEVAFEAKLLEDAIPEKKYVFPSVNLLKKSTSKTAGNTEKQLRETAAKLQQTLRTFGVNVTVTDISCGPAVTRYEIQPEMGVKVSKIVGLADDIKLNLAAADIRIEAPIPGKAAVGIEVPNPENVMVSFRELIESEEFKNARSTISFAVGKDIAGKVKVADIAKMPHLLIAGATGSGKSVCINTIIMSILYKADPNEVKLIMIDPKVVELSVYNGIPHLMIPVVTDPKKAAAALNWAVAEMTERYEKFAECSVRDINGYNAKLDKIEVPEGQPRPQKMPKIVIIVDELADLMMVASNDVEESICRLAQLARACGIHLIIATQRPSVNVITGLIKANMPSRIAFAVTSGVDSRTILDMVGAEKLLGKGDMLFYPQGIPKPLRVQGAFVSDEEVSNVVDFLKDNNGSAEYNPSVQQKMDSLQNSSAQAVAISDADSEGDGRDSYFMEAAQIIVDKEKASIGMLQRYLKVGFNRAARIMDQLEEAGIVGPEEGTKPRRVLMTSEDLQQFIDENI